MLSSARRAKLFNVSSLGETPYDTYPLMPAHYSLHIYIKKKTKFEVMITYFCLISLYFSSLNLSYLKFTKWT